MSKLEALADRLDSVIKDSYDVLRKTEDCNKRLASIAKEIYAMVQRQTVPRVITVEGVRQGFTEEQLEFLQVEDAGDHVRVEFNKYVPKVMFSDVANRVKGVRGKYFEKTASTAPHFKIPK